MSDTKVPTPSEAGEKRNVNSGFRVIANDTTSGRPWMWYCPTLDAAKLLAKKICETNGEELAICKYVGRVKRSTSPTEFIEGEEEIL